MATVTLTPGELPQPACYGSEQERFDAYVAAILASITDGIQWEASQVAPADVTLYWLRLDANNRPIEALQWSTADGAWVRWLSGVINSSTSAGAGNAYTLANTPALLALRDQQVFVFRANHTNTGASTLNVDGLGALAIKKYLADDLGAGDIQEDQIVVVVYDASLGIFQFASAARPVENHGSQVYTSGSGNFTVPAGVYSIEVECGGGGGGGDWGGTAKGGGGGGWNYKRWSVSPGQLIPYAVGAGGARTTSYGGGQNQDGGNSTFNTTQIANGGAKGSSGGAGGAHSGGDWGIDGSPGTRCSDAPDSRNHFLGGVSALRGSVGGEESDTAAAALAGRYGGGGAGDSDVTDNDSSAGGSGMIVIRW